MFRPLLLACLLLTLVAGCRPHNPLATAPEDQPLDPGAAAPDRWRETDLGVLTIATPPRWTVVSTDSGTEATAETTWRDTSDPVRAGRAGVSVRVIIDFQQSTEQVAKDIATSAAMYRSGDLEPEPLQWPGAVDAYHFAYLATVDAAVGAPGYETRTVVFGLPDAHQVVVTAAVHEDADPSIPTRILDSITLHGVGQR